MKNNQKGFSALHILLAVVVVLIGFVGWYVYNSNHKTTTTPTNAAPSTIVPSNGAPSSRQPLAESTSVYDISNLGLKFDLPSSLSDLTYKPVHLEGDQALNSVEFSSKRLEAAGCNLSSAPLGILTYDNDKGGTKVANARASDLYYLKPTGSCSADISLQNWQKLQDALKTLVSDE